MAIHPWDILPLPNKIFFHSYRRVEINKRATSDQGWSPTNQKLLSHPDLQKQVSTNQDPPTDLTNLNSLNLDTGYLMDCIDQIMQHCAHNGGITCNGKSDSGKEMGPSLHWKKPRE
jgi:hypothetical protein